jgi:hypothetical protein
MFSGYSIVLETVSIPAVTLSLYVWLATMPDTWIVVECPLCGVNRRYLPADIFRGKLSHKLIARPLRLGARHG